jgi:transposase InsO family protein
MRNTTNDKTLEINYVKKFRFLIKEYLLVKEKKHPKFRFVADFYKFHNTNRQTFLKYYNRFAFGNTDYDLLPQKRGPKWKSRRPLPYIENKVLECRKSGLNRYEIVSILKPKLKQFTPSPSGVYNIIKRYNLNKLTTHMKAEKRQIIKSKAGDLAHIDCHYLAKDIVAGVTDRLYLIAIIDDASRIAWVEIIPNIKSLTTMFATLRIFNYFLSEHDIAFKELLSDNGSEFGGKNIKSPEEHPFERMLIEMNIKHRYTRPYRPQTNGKVERFWKTIESDLLEDMAFESLNHLQDEISQYLHYYNHERPHQGINGSNPVAFLAKLSTN